MPSDQALTRTPPPTDHDATGVVLATSDDIAIALEETAEEYAGLGWHRRLLALIPAGQFARYLGVGIFNTIFGYTTFVIALSLLNRALPQRLLYLTVVLASVLSTPLNITVAFFGYKYLVFRTRGKILSEWAKCFAVYGVGMLPGLIALSAVTRLLQTVFHRHAATLHAQLFAVEKHLSGRSLHLLQHAASGKAMAGYIAGAMLTALTTISSFIGHKKVTFRRAS